MRSFSLVRMAPPSAADDRSDRNNTSRRSTETAAEDDPPTEPVYRRRCASPAAALLLALASPSSAGLRRRVRTLRHVCCRTGRPWRGMRMGSGGPCRDLPIPDGAAATCACAAAAAAARRDALRPALRCSPPLAAPGAGARRPASAAGLRLWAASSRPPEQPPGRRLSRVPLAAAHAAAATAQRAIDLLGGRHGLRRVAACPPASLACLLAVLCDSAARRGQRNAVALALDAGSALASASRAGSSRQRLRRRRLPVQRQHLGERLRRLRARAVLLQGLSDHLSVFAQLTARARRLAVPGDQRRAATCRPTSTTSSSAGCPRARRGSTSR